MPSGQVIAGKWFGNKTSRPFLCIHGWEDNAGTFDQLIPLLPREFSYLAIDLPGHGKSSWIPNGQSYKVIDMLYVVDFIFRHYNWNKISFIAHSMGVRIAFMYSSLYPERVDMSIKIDVLAISNYTFEEVQSVFHEQYDKFLKNHKINLEKSEPPVYTIDEITDKIVKGTNGSITKETAIYLFERNIKPSKKYPGKFFFSRDRRVQTRKSISAPQEIQLELAKKLTMPILYIRVTESSYRKISRELNENKLMKEVLMHHPNFECHTIKSTSHHIHLTEPEKIVPIICEFIRKYKKSIKCNL